MPGLLDAKVHILRLLDCIAGVATSVFDPFDFQLAIVSHVSYSLCLKDLQRGKGLLLL